VDAVGFHFKKIKHFRVRFMVIEREEGNGLGGRMEVKRRRTRRRRKDGFRSRRRIRKKKEKEKRYLKYLNFFN